MWCTHKKISKWINLEIENPFKTWWKVKKYFKFPRITVNNSTQYNNGFGKIFNLVIRDITWKDKFYTPKHEINPFIYISLFQTFNIWITPTITFKDELNKIHNGDKIYWEYILNYLYYNKTLKCYPQVTSYSRLYKIKEYTEESEFTKPLISVIPSVSMCLNKNGIKELKKQL